MAIFTPKELVQQSQVTQTPTTIKVVPSGTQETTIQEKPSFLQGVASDLSKRNTAMYETQQSDQGFGSKVLQTFGQGFGAVGDIAKRAILSAGSTISDITPESVKQPFSQGFSATIKDLASTDTGKSAINALSQGQEAYNQFKLANPEAAKNIEATVDIVSVVPVLQGLRDAGLLTQAVGVGAKDILKTATEKTIGAVKSAVPVVESAIMPVSNAISAVSDATKLAMEGASRIPSRIATNVAEKKAVQETIKALPTKVAQRAVQDGVDIRDVQTLSSLPKAQKPAVIKLVKNVQDFASGKSKIDPMETVGQPFVSRLKTLQSEQSKIGQKLGEVSKNLGDVSEADVFYPVYDSLKTTRGLEGLKLAEDGTLDFSNTVLNATEAQADRSAIQTIFNDAVSAGTGEQKHLLRQGLREILGGKSKGGVQLTSTQKDAYESVRKGLSNVLDAKNPEYKAINAQYAKVSKPIDELSSILKAGTETSDDVLNLSGGILARRLTSAGIGNAKVRQVLQLVDNATKVKGKTLSSVETMQDVLNVLGKYYDIAPRTGYKNLTQEAVSGGVKDFVSSAVTNVAGKTVAVRKKALEDLLKQSLSD